MKAPSRTLVSAALLLGLLAVLMIGWFVAGWAEVRARQTEERMRPVTAAAQRAEELARDLRAEIDTLIAREIERPYFHYQSLFRDPRASASVSVAPSPLSSGASDPLVLGYFQIDAKGRVTTPTINDEVPELSEPTRLAGNMAFRDRVASSLGVTYRPPDRAEVTPVLVAQADPPKPRPRPVPSPTPIAPPPTAPEALPDAAVAPQPQAPPTQVPRSDPGPQQQQVRRVESIDYNVYQQNSYSNSIYLENNPRSTPPPKKRTAPRAAPVATPEVKVPTLELTTEIVEAGAPDPTPESATVATPVAKPPVTKRRPQPRVVSSTIEKLENKSVTITVAPLALATEMFGAGSDPTPTLVATRLVETPDGALTQGFVIDRAQIDRWLASRGANAAFVHQSALVADERSSTEQVAPEWLLQVRPPAADLSATAATAGRLATTFLVRFIALGSLAVLAALTVLVLLSRAERLARERSHFAAAAAHELRTPLAGLQLYGDMIADGLGDPDKQRDYAKRMAEEAARLGRVVSNVLGFSQLERGNLSVDPKPGDLAAELSAIASRAEPALDRAGAVLSLEVTPELRATFDRDALARIVGNLLDNAEKYSRDAEDRTITLSARTVGAHVEIEVTDHGPGVAPAVRKKLFEAFARGVSADGPAGLGLGLALSQSLARAMGGELEFRPPSDGGAGFVLRLAIA